MAALAGGSSVSAVNQHLMQTLLILQNSRNPTQNVESTWQRDPQDQQRHCGHVQATQSSQQPGQQLLPQQYYSMCQPELFPYQLQLHAPQHYPLPSHQQHHANAANTSVAQSLIRSPKIMMERRHTASSGLLAELTTQGNSCPPVHSRGVTAALPNAHQQIWPFQQRFPYDSSSLQPPAKCDIVSFSGIGAGGPAQRDGSVAERGVGEVRDQGAFIVWRRCRRHASGSVMDSLH